MKRYELEKLMSDIADGKVDISTIDDEVKEKLFKLARRKINMMIFQKWLMIFRDFSWIIVGILIFLVIYQIYMVLNGYFTPLIIP